MTLERYLERIDELAPVVREHSTRSERDAQLARVIVEAMHAAGLFRISSRRAWAAAS